MKLHFGGQTFVNVTIPLLWGKRAVVGHTSGLLSVIDLSATKAKPEIVADVPWHGVSFSESEDGFVIFDGATRLYFFSPPRKLLRDLVGSLPECQILNDATIIGTNTIRRGMISGSPVGIGVSEDGFFIGGPMPAGLAELVI